MTDDLTKLIIAKYITSWNIFLYYRVISRTRFKLRNTKYTENPNNLTNLILYLYPQFT